MGDRKSILVIEDAADFCQTLCFNLEREGYACRKASDGRTGLAEVKRRRPDLIVLDRMLPEVSGDELAVRLRNDPESRCIPIIMLTAKAEEADEVVGLALGADDYLAKPVSIRKLLARIAALLRRVETSAASSTRLDSGPFTLDLERHELHVDSSPVELTPTEFRIIHALMANGGRVLSRNKLIDAAMGTTAAVTDRTIDVHVTSIRKKIAEAQGPAAAAWIRTVRGVGYSFRSPAECA
jgi:two-component system phosphate regulon response regulator PhoB